MITIYLMSVILVVLLAVILKNIKIISIITNILNIFLVGIAINYFNILHNLDSISIFNGIFYIDGLNIIQLLLISIISMIGGFYSRKYILEEIAENKITIFYGKLYFILFNLFVLSMIIVAISNNIILIWIALEATTLSTAFLIGFNREKLSLEAAWKYIIICSVGITIGLIGIILIMYSTKSSSTEVLRWSYLIKNYSIIDPKIAKYAFAFIFVGIATKAGLAPMHTWLPDGHSESPSPISAMMSGVLLNLALYVVIRFYVVLEKIGDIENIRYLFLIFGFISLIISSFSILKQKNYKRLLAFSSVENMGIIAIGIGIGSNLAIYGAILHSIIHAFGKTLLFLVSGNIFSEFKTKKIDKVNNLIRVMPINSIILILGILIITGVPPFASFLSEYSIFTSMIINNNFILAFIYMICLLIVFSGFISIFIKMIFVSSDDLRGKSKKDRINIFPLVLTLIIIIIISFNSEQLNLLIDGALNVIGDVR